MKQIRIGYLSTLYHTSHILKHQGSIDDKLGVEAQWRLFGTGPAMIEAFARKELDLGYIGLPPAMIGISRGLPLKCIAGGHVEGTVLVGPAALGTAQNADDRGRILAHFAGKKIGAPARGSIHDIIIRHLLDKNGVAGASVVNYPWADLMPQAIEDGEIAAAVGTPPLAAVAQAWYGHSIITPPRLLWPFNPGCGIVVHAAMMKDQSFLEGFIGLHEQACTCIREQPDEAARILSQEVKVVNAEFVQKVFAVSPHYCAALPEAYRAATMAFVPVLRELGYINRELSEQEIFDLSFIENVHPGPHHY
jgi:NitT/TauT family transport system substrate-binding protein